MTGILKIIKDKLDNLLCPILRYTRRKIAPNPWTTYEELEILHNELTSRKDINSKIFENFERYLSYAKKELCSIHVNYVYFWKLLHKAKIESLLLIDRDKFINEAINIISQFDNVVDDENLRKIWLGSNWSIDILNQILNGEPVESNGILPKSLQVYMFKPSLSEEEERKIRLNFKNALRILYDYFIDGNIYKLSLAYSYMNYSSIIFLAIFIIFMPFYMEEVLRTLAPVLLPGFMGALISNIITYRDKLPQEIFLLALRGIIGKPLFFNLIGKGVIGSFSAYLIYKASQAGILFSLKSINTEYKDAYIIVLSFVAGFSGITLVNKFIEGVLSRLTSKLEKTTVSKVKSKIKNYPPPTRGIQR